VWGYNEDFVGEQVKLAHQKLVGDQAKAPTQIDKLLIVESEKAAENARKLKEAQKKALAA
jgi:hypothetical protein